MGWGEEINSDWFDSLLKMEPNLWVQAGRRKLLKYIKQIIQKHLTFRQMHLAFRQAHIIMKTHIYIFHQPNVFCNCTETLLYCISLQHICIRWKGVSILVLNVSQLYDSWWMKNNPCKLILHFSRMSIVYLLNLSRECLFS